MITDAVVLQGPTRIQEWERGSGNGSHGSHGVSTSHREPSTHGHTDAAGATASSLAHFDDLGVGGPNNTAQVRSRCDIEKGQGLHMQQRTVAELGSEVGTLRSHAGHTEHLKALENCSVCCCAGFAGRRGAGAARVGIVRRARALAVLHSARAANGGRAGRDILQ